MRIPCNPVRKVSLKTVDDLCCRLKIRPVSVKIIDTRILQNSEVKKHKVFLKIKKDFTPSNANK